MNSIKTSLYSSLKNIRHDGLSNDSERYFVEQLLKNQLDLYLFPNVEIHGGECDFVLISEGKKTKIFFIEVKELKGNKTEESIEKLSKQMKRNYNVSKVIFGESCEIVSYGLFICEKDILFEYLYVEGELKELDSGSILKDLSTISSKTSRNYEIIKKLKKIPLYCVYDNEDDSVVDYIKNKFYLTSHQESLYDKIIGTSKNTNIQLYDIASGRGKTTVLIKLIAENKDKKILFISAHGRNITTRSNVSHKTPKELDNEIQKINDYDWVICDEAQRIYAKTYDKCKQFIEKSHKTKMVFLGDTRCSLEEDNKLIPVEEYNKDMNEMPDIRCNETINKFVDCLVYDKTMEDFESDIINIVHNEAFNQNNDTCFTLTEKYDEKRAINVLGRGFEKVSIYIPCSFKYFNATKEKRFSVFKQLKIYATRAIEELNIICKDYELVNYFYSILESKQESKCSAFWDKQDQKSYDDIVDTMENEYIKMYANDSQFTQLVDIPCYILPTIKNIKLNDFKSFQDVKEHIEQYMELSNYKKFFQEQEHFFDKEEKERYVNKIREILIDRLENKIGDFINE